MKLTKQVAVDLMAAMKNQEKGKLDALRSLKTAFILAKSETGATDLADDEELKIVQKLIKQRRDSAAEYIANNRQDLADKENSEADVLSAYLPKQLSVEEITDVVKQIIAEVGATSMKEMGKVMGIASKKLAGSADGKAISDVVKTLLS
ncbi:MAG: GatB/YqeY domain-containing protein [Bacteroidales bacterium]|nr:GatB/YqeY domain-containing protein [Bacteroidales bacterium]